MQVSIFSAFKIQMIDKELKHISVSIDNWSINSHTNKLSLLLILWGSTSVYSDSLLPEGDISYLDAGKDFFPPIQMNPPTWQL